MHRIFRNLKKWSILISCNNNQKNDFNYIYKKLNYLINKDKLNEQIEIIYLINDDNINDNRKKLIEKSKSDWISFLDVNSDISENFIIDIFNNLNFDYIRFKKHYVNQNKTKTKKNDYSFIIKKSTIPENYHKSNFFKPSNLKLLENVLLFEKNEKKENVSIIITAYESQNFIKECLDSVYSQSYFNEDNFEVLIGVDGCEKTYEKLNEIKNNYKNLKIFMMKDNKGTYITTNTLIDQVKYENVIRFDSDDIMFPMLVENVIDFKTDYDIVKIGFDGIIYFKKSVMDNILGGYQPWFVAADSELLKRAENKLKIGELKTKLFNRRFHTNSLTNRKDTGANSEMRNNYISLIKPKYKNNEILKIDRVTNEIKYDDKKSISIIVTAYQTQDFIEECLDSIENQTYFINNNNFEVLIGIDACEKTLEKLKEIKDKYRNLRIFMMDSNMGTYVTSNTLLDLVQYENILRFDSDDIMKTFMVEEVIKYSNEYDIIRFSYDNFINSINNIILNEKLHYPHGVILYNRKTLNLSGGYQSWICAADTEFIERVKSVTNILLLPKKVFFRRRHNNSLTKNKNTNFNSEIRKSYRNIIGKHQNIWIDKKINTYYEVL